MGLRGFAIELKFSFSGLSPYAPPPCHLPSLWNTQLHHHLIAHQCRTRSLFSLADARRSTATQSSIAAIERERERNNAWLAVEDHLHQIQVDIHAWSTQFGSSFVEYESRPYANEFWFIIHSRISASWLPEPSHGGSGLSLFRCHRCCRISINKTTCSF